MLEKTKIDKDKKLHLKSIDIWNGDGKEYILTNFLNQKGVVYFIGDVNLLYCKIGITGSIYSLSHRFRVIQGNNPMKLKLHGFIQDTDYRRLEKRLHQQFSKYHRMGEWFIYSPEISNYVKENCMKIELANTLWGETYLNMEQLY